MGRFKSNDPRWKKSIREKKAMRYKDPKNKRAAAEIAADLHRKEVLSEYKKVLANEAKQLKEYSAKVKKIYEEACGDSDENDTNTGKTATTQKFPKSKRKVERNPEKISAFHKEIKALEDARKTKEEKRQAREKQEKERDEAMDKYREKKKNTYRLLQKKSYKGQPFMGARMKLLLDKIEAADANN